MKRTFLTVCATLIALMSYGQNAGQEFTMKPMEYTVIDNTVPFREGNAQLYTDSDINVHVILQQKREDTSVPTEQWRCKYGEQQDTLIIGIQRYDFMSGWITVRKYDSGITIPEYLKDNYANAHNKAATLIERHKSTLAIHHANYAEVHGGNPEIWKQERLQAEADVKAYQENQARRRIIGDMEYEFTEPTGPIQTKSGTNAFGAKVTYQYYVNENGYEVKHGKMTTTMTFKDHKYWTGLSKLGYVYVTGTETLTETYRNDILHGPLTYRCNVNTDATFSNPEKLNISYDLNIYKGFLNGNFKFEYNGITYTGKAVNGILEYCNYQTNDGFHSKLTSNPNSKSVSVAEIDNGVRKFEFDSEIKLPSIIAVMPTFRFPLIGK